MWFTTVFFYLEISQTFNITKEYNLNLSFLYALARASVIVLVLPLFSTRPWNRWSGMEVRNRTSLHFVLLPTTRQKNLC